MTVFEYWFSVFKDFGDTEEEINKAGFFFENMYPTEIRDFECVRTSRSMYYKKLPITLIKPTEEGAELFNKIYQRYKDRRKCFRTHSGGIATPPHGDWDIHVARSWVELLLVDPGMRIQLRCLEEDDNGNKISGTSSFNRFRRLCEKYGININDFALPGEEGLDVKEKIPDPYIWCDKRYINTTLCNCYHVDFHSSHMAGLANTHPEFRPVVEDMYNRRKEEPIYKQVLTHVWGYFQAAHHGAKWAHLSKDALEDNNRRIDELTKLLEKRYKIIAYNTDGIWIQDDLDWGEPEGPGKGPNLGEWGVDHKRCKIRFRSKGAYEYMENGEYHPVVRGLTDLDKVKARKDWIWGDIFKVKILTYHFENDRGIVYEYKTVEQIEQEL